MDRVADVAPTLDGFDVAVHRVEFRAHRHDRYVAHDAVQIKARIEAKLLELGKGGELYVLAQSRDGRELVLIRYTEPELELNLLLKKLKLELPAQPPPKITPRTRAAHPAVVPTFGGQL